MPQRLVVTGNCQASSLEAVLAGLLPEATITAFDHRMHMHDSSRVAALAAISTADAWITTRAERDHLMPQLSGSPPPIHLWPAMEFTGYHPDQVMAFLPGGLPFMGCCSGYHSAIGLWAWKHGMDAGRASQLFRSEVFEALGYFSHFEPARRHMEHAFDECGMEFQSAWLAFRRQGPFMHTVNHPALPAVLTVARVLAARLGASSEALREPLERYIEDPLSYVVWPIYPPIARHLGIQGGWRLRFRDHQWPGLLDWLDDLFTSYGGQDPEAVNCDRIAGGGLDALLAPFLRTQS